MIMYGALSVDTHARIPCSTILAAYLAVIYPPQQNTGLLRTSRLQGQALLVWLKTNVVHQYTAEQTNPRRTRAERRSPSSLVNNIGSYLKGVRIAAAIARTEYFFLNPYRNLEGY